LKSPAREKLLRRRCAIKYNAAVREPSDLTASANESGRFDSNVELAPGVHVPASALRIQFARSGGPGGQNVNKLNTKAELWVPLEAIAGIDEGARLRLRTLAGKRLTRDGLVHISAQTERTQEGNRQAVLDRLRAVVQQALIAPRPRKRTRPSKASKRRRIETKRHRGQIKALRGRAKLE
jgi:ribosome-associated protein